MEKLQLTESDYIKELNRQLKLHEYYEEGMVFYANPKNASGENMSGYSVNGPSEKIGVFALIACKVSESYDLKGKK